MGQPGLPALMAEAPVAAAGPVGASDAGVGPLVVLPVPMGHDRAGTAGPRGGEEARAIPAIATSPAVTSSRYAGAMLLHVALTQLRVWQVFAEGGAHVGRTTFSVAQVVGMVALGFALRLGSIERFKTALARDFGLLLGLRVVPCVQTLRTHVCALAESVAPEAIMRALLAACVHLEPVWEGAYYVDGHFTPYAGQAPVGKGGSRYPFMRPADWSRTGPTRRWFGRSSATPAWRPHRPRASACRRVSCAVARRD